MNTKEQGTEAGRRYWLFQNELKGFVLEQNNVFIPKWMAFIKGYTPDGLKSNEFKIVARKYTDSEKEERFKNLKNI